MSRPHYAKRFARAPQVTQQQLDELTQRIEQTECAIRSGLFGDEPFTTDPLSNDWDWAASTIQRALFVGWTSKDLRAVRKAQKVDPYEWNWELPKGMWEVLRDKILAAGGAVDRCGFLSHATLPSLKNRRAELKRELRNKRSRMEAQR
jgi:hypothetical protein